MKSNSYERIIAVSTHLFALNGYDGTSIRDIAEVVDLNVATILHHIGSKEQLYRTVFQRIYTQEKELFSRLFASITDEQLSRPQGVRDVLEQFIDAYTGYVVQDPDAYRLWVYNFIDDTDRFKHIEHQYSLPLYEILLDVLRRACAAGSIHDLDIDIRELVMGISWLMYGYFNGRKNDWGDPAYDRYAPESIFRFRQIMARYIERMITYRPETETQ